MSQNPGKQEIKPTIHVTVAETGGKKAMGVIKEVLSDAKLGDAFQLAHTGPDPQSGKDSVTMHPTKPLRADTVAQLMGELEKSMKRAEPPIRAAPKRYAGAKQVSGAQHTSYMLPKGPDPLDHFKIKHGHGTVVVTDMSKPQVTSNFAPQVPKTPVQKQGISGVPETKLLTRKMIEDAPTIMDVKPPARLQRQRRQRNPGTSR